MSRIRLAAYAVAFGVASLLAVSPVRGQNQNQSLALDLPLASQRASVSQRLGLTTIKIDYHRPLTRGRKVWGDLVPWGQVWRAGANENTVISFTDPVTVEGQPLAKGAYGLHMIPAEGSWTVIFSKNSTSWGSFTYDEKEDALRVTVKPSASELHDALTYDFDGLTADSAVVTMRWEMLAVPFQVAVDVPKKTMENLSSSFEASKRTAGWVGTTPRPTASRTRSGTTKRSSGQTRRSRTRNGSRT